MEGDPLDPITTYGPQTDKAQYDNICKFLRKAREDCVNFLLGGPPMAQEDGGLLVPPTLAHNPPEDNDLMKEGVFGAVSCVVTFTDEEDVIRRANGTVYSLYASVFTPDINRALRVAKTFEAGQ
ncbi:hypothetical protein PV05_04716 [Exophiala xenobiotica]|uniref:aldehyde dehydrogenase (NAD(+)) n=1 Tax=Exophiala xenobiotica TaxID=348802 RepID=A0A0D2EMW3_9EURO|nr:uncharacterized protein PV05_04716 [Exophiala xenobiotica]KIW56015.1 hypothetical protein PV05_04716 [Exophiala xenobiotica]